MPTKSDSKVGVCAFCASSAPLQQSHVLPAFVYRWLRKRSGNGHIRDTENPNRRVQDGLKFPWLCTDCEARFNGYETAFATKVFHQWLAGNHLVAYDEWMLKFCVSVSWRVLRFARGRNKDAQHSPQQHVLMDQAEVRWRDFLIDRAPHPASFEQHLLIVDEVHSSTIRDLPTNTNRFLMGGVTLDIVGSERSLMTFAKMGRFMLFGMIQKGHTTWQGTKIHVRQGVLKPGPVTVPAGLLDLIREKAAHSAAAMDKISPTQRAKIDQNDRDNLDAFAASEQFASIAADMRMFGKEAVIWKNNPAINDD
jgi:hypothetical protein